MPLPADATEFVDAPTIECDALGCVAFRLVLLGDHCVKSSSTISVAFVNSDQHFHFNAMHLVWCVCVLIAFLIWFRVCFWLAEKERKTAKKREKCFCCCKTWVMQAQVIYLINIIAFSLVFF